MTEIARNPTEAAQLRTALSQLVGLALVQTPLGTPQSLDRLQSIARDLPQGYSIAVSYAVGGGHPNVQAQAVGGYFVDQQGTVTGLIGATLSFLTAEFAEARGVKSDGFGGALFSSRANDNAPWTEVRDAA